MSLALPVVTNEMTGVKSQTIMTCRPKPSSRRMSQIDLSQLHLQHPISVCILQGNFQNIPIIENSNYAQKFLQAHTEFRLKPGQENGAKIFVACLINMGLHRQTTIASL